MATKTLVYKFCLVSNGRRFRHGAATLFQVGAELVNLSLVHPHS